VYVPAKTTTPFSRVAPRSLYEIAASVDTYHQAPKTLYSSVASVPTQKIATPASYGTRNYPNTTYSSASTQNGWVKQPTVIRGDLGSVAIQPSVISPLPGYVITTPSVGIAQNGSYYGQPNSNGIPKTVAVNGYYRKDGTYVQGHYRSAPGSNPSSSRKK
jgi:hypothetical protein